MQLLYIGMVWWTSIKEGSREAGRLRAPKPVTEHEHASCEGTTS